MTEKAKSKQVKVIYAIVLFIIAGKMTYGALTYKPKVKKTKAVKDNKQTSLLLQKEATPQMQNCFIFKPQA